MSGKRKWTKYNAFYELFAFTHTHTNTYISILRLNNFLWVFWIKGDLTWVFHFS